MVCNIKDRWYQVIFESSTYWIKKVSSQFDNFDRKVLKEISCLVIYFTVNQLKQEHYTKQHVFKKTGYNKIIIK